MAAARGLVLYRTLLRARQVAFSGDEVALAAAKARIRTNFEENRDVTDPAKLEELITVGNEVAHTLRHGVIQGRKTAEGNFRLKIHKDIALNDNAKIQNAGEGVVV